MSFGYGVGDVIAVLGLFERIAIELRNYKDAPMQFQQLRAELDLLRGTLERVLSLEPEGDAERETLEQIRAIVIYCAQPLQSMADKMRSKESSLGHFRTTRSLGSIGTRLHWSMIDRSDIEELRKILLSQMAAINTLLSVQSQTRLQRLVLQMKISETHQTLAIEKHTNAIAGQATNILNITSRTQSTIDALALQASVQAEIHSKQADEINQSLNSIEQNMRHMTLKSEQCTTVVRRQAFFISRQVQNLFHLMQDIKELFILRMLLNIGGQMKLMMRAIEAIPLHLTLDIVRLDDVHGESWALPLQACRTWKNLFAVTQAKTGKGVDQETWEAMIKPGFHIEQAVILKGSHSSKRCLNPKCAGMLQDEVLEFEDRQVWFKLLQPAEPIQDIEEAYRRLGEDPNHAMANAYVGLETLLSIGETVSVDQIDIARNHLEVAVVSDSSIPENWYLLSRACMKAEDYERAYQCLQTAVYLESRCPSFWITLGILYFNIGQSRDCLDALTKAVELNAHIWEPWYNLGVLYDSCNGQHSDAADAFYKCLERKPELRNVRARLEAQQAYAGDMDDEFLGGSLIHEMVDSPLDDKHGW
ncbi:general transcriptional corepressor ssn6 [Fusarium sp. NRRL 25303]|nr:general transcriptional corepressor ssn6 [Fusarium sp. NRRL 25303]